MNFPNSAPYSCWVFSTYTTLTISFAFLDWNNPNWFNKSRVEAASSSLKYVLPLKFVLQTLGCCKQWDFCNKLLRSFSSIHSSLPSKMQLDFKLSNQTSASCFIICSKSKSWLFISSSLVFLFLFGREMLETWQNWRSESTNNFSTSFNFDGFA